MLTFVWLCKCMPAIVNAAWGSIVFLSLPQTGSNIQSKMGKLHITSLPLLGKFIIIFFVQLPLLALDIALAIVGMKFLMPLSCKESVEKDRDAGIWQRFESKHVKTTSS